MSDNVKQYTQVEEILNTVSHALGALFAIYAIVMLAVASKTPIQTTSTAIFGASLFLLFHSSTIYHGMVGEKAKSVFRKIDHSAIYILIAGTYTPLLLLGIKFPLSIALLGMVWYIAIIGIVYSCISLKCKYLSTSLYLLLSWLSVFLLFKLWYTVNHEVIWYFLGGGAVYTLGTIFYLSKRKFMHSIWHLFVVGGAIMHYIAITKLL